MTSDHDFLPLFLADFEFLIENLLPLFLADFEFLIENLLPLFFADFLSLIEVCTSNSYWPQFNVPLPQTMANNNKRRKP